MAVSCGSVVFWLDCFHHDPWIERCWWSSSSLRQAPPALACTRPRIMLFNPSQLQRDCQASEHLPAAHALVLACKCVCKCLLNTTLQVQMHAMHVLTVLPGSPAALIDRCHPADMGWGWGWHTVQPMSTGLNPADGVCGCRFDEIMTDIETGMFGDKEYFKPLVDSISNMKVGNDWFLVANDFASYLDAQEEVDRVRGELHCMVHDDTAQQVIMGPPPTPPRQRVLHAAARPYTMAEAGISQLLNIAPW